MGEGGKEEGSGEQSEIELMRVSVKDSLSEFEEKCKSEVSLLS